jgi:hypothetical protein
VAIVVDACRIAEQLLAGTRCKASEAEAQVPTHPGYYAIFIDAPEALLTSFRDRLNERGHIYVGIATKSLRGRLLEQDLRHKRPSTFFGSLGAALGYWPKPGSLVGKKNQQNYRFHASDTSKIVNWINAHLAIRWVEAAGPDTKSEAQIIRQLEPIFNITHNPEALPELAKARDQCLQIARTSLPDTIDPRGPKGGSR